MSQVWKILVVVILMGAVALVVTLKHRNKSELSITVAENKPTVVSTKLDESTTKRLNQSKVLPRLVDLGAGTCIPCKLMAPILEELKTEYADQINVEILDVRQDPNVISEYHIRVIPTQIFYDALGQERFHHEGFMSKEDILAMWEQLGVEFSLKE